MPANISMRIVPALSLALGCLMPCWANASSSVSSDENEGEEPPAFYHQWEAFSNSKLDQMRGGFTTGGKLQISFGFERLTLVDGELAAYTRFVVSPTKGVGSEQLPAFPGVRLGQLATALSTPEISENLSGNEKLVLDSIVPILERISDTIPSPKDFSSIVIQGGSSQSLPGLNPLSMVLQNNTDNKLIQSIQLLNIQLTNVGKYNSHSINDFLTQQLLAP